jgi:ABC-2 type transport system ATP-binding protein
LYDGALKQLVGRFEDRRQLVVTFADPQTALLLPGLLPPQRDGAQVIYSFNPKTHSAAQVLAMLNDSQTLLDLKVRRPGLEDTIRRIYEQQLLVSEMIEEIQQARI